MSWEPEEVVKMDDNTGSELETMVKEVASFRQVL